MDRTRVFISSTCYDLRQERVVLADRIRALGHEALLSEEPSFPVAPERGLVENCKRAVQDHTDVFVLVVGGRRGSLDPMTGVPVTNVEYDVAAGAGHIIFVFVHKTVLSLLGVWERNPHADFAPSVDYPAVFEFVKRLHRDEQWIFPFETAQDVAETLEVQLSSQLRQLLEQRRAGDKRIPPEFLGESVEAQVIVRDRPAGWEYRLAAALVSTKLARVERDFADLDNGTHFIRTHDVPADEAFDWLKNRLAHMLDVLGLLRQVLNEEFTASFGPPGQPAGSFHCRLWRCDQCECAFGVAGAGA
jgi:hypothetical protein